MFACELELGFGAVFSTFFFDSAEARRNLSILERPVSGSSGSERDDFIDGATLRNL